MAAPTQIGTLPAGATGSTGSAGTNAINQTTTTASFTMPAAGTSVVVAMTSVAFMVVGQALYISSASSTPVGNGIISVISSLNVTWIPDGSPGNLTSGTIATAAKVTLSGRRGSKLIGTYAPGALPSSDSLSIFPGDWVIDTAGAYYQYLT